MRPDFGATVSDEEIFVPKNTSKHVKPLGFVVDLVRKFDFIYLAG